MKVLHLLCFVAAAVTAHGFFLHDYSPSYGDDLHPLRFDHEFFGLPRETEESSVFMSSVSAGDKTTQRVVRTEDGVSRTTVRTRQGDGDWEYTQSSKRPQALSRCARQKLDEPSKLPQPKRPCGCRSRLLQVTNNPEAPTQQRAVLNVEKATEHEEPIDYDAIAAETVASTPARHRGIREEWGRREGWGRREKLTEESAEADADDEADEADEGDADEDNTLSPHAWGTGRDGQGRRFQPGDVVDVKILQRGAGWRGDHATAVVHRANEDGSFDLAHLDGTPVVPALRSGIRSQHLRASHTTAEGSSDAHESDENAPHAWGTGQDGQGRRFQPGDVVDVKILENGGRWRGEHTTTVVARAYKDGRYDLKYLSGTPVIPALKSGIRGRHLRHLRVSQVAAVEAKEAARRAHEEQQKAQWQAQEAARKAEEQATRAAAEARQRAAEEAAAQAARQREVQVRAAEEAQQAADVALAQRQAEMEAMQQKYHAAQAQAESAAKVLAQMKQGA